MPLLLLLFLTCSQAVFAVNGRLEYNNQSYSFVNGAAVRKEADKLFTDAFNSLNEVERDKYYSRAMQKYFILSKAMPDDAYAYVQIARIHDELGRDKLAKQYYFMASNLDSTNPYANYYFAEYLSKNAKYNKALKYYLTAYNNGYQNNYYANLKLADIYKRLGDLKKSKEFYTKTYKINPSNQELNEKIKSIDSLNSEESEYYHFIRE